MVDISDVHDEGVVYLNWEKRDKHSLANQTPETISLLTYSAGLYQVGSSQGKKEEKTFLRIKLFHFLQDRLRHLFFADDKESINQIPGDNEEWLTLSPRSKWTESDNLYQTWGKKGVERVKKYILKISELCRKHNTNFSFVIYPWPTQLQSKRRPSKQQEVFSEFALANDLVFYDLYQDFFILDNWRSYFIYADNHWNEKGHYFIANLLYEKLSPKNTEIQNTL
jgi:hypothetical protein